MNELLSRIEKMKGKTKKYYCLFFYLMAYAFLLLLSYSTSWFMLLLNGAGLIASAVMVVYMLLHLIKERTPLREYTDPNPLLMMGVWILMAVMMGLAEPYETIPLLGGALMLLAAGAYTLYTIIRWIIYRIARLRKPAPQPSVVQPAPAPNRGIPKSRPVNIHPVYQQDLDQLAAHIRDLEEREAAVSVFLDSFFADSAISKSRYLTVILNAKHVLEANYENALRAAGMFGGSVPTPERVEIMDRYVSDSADVMSKIDRVINQLIAVQQSDLLADGSVLDGLLDDLAATTSYYQRSTTL